jgi:periplasmic protein TonB
VDTLIIWKVPAGRVQTRPFFFAPTAPASFRTVSIQQTDLMPEGTMSANIFADSMLEISWAQRGRRSWTTLSSFGLQAVMIGLLLLIPLLRTVGAPTVLKTVSTPISAGRPESPTTPRPRTANSAPVPSNSTAPRFLAPGRIPQTIQNPIENSSLDPVGSEPCTGVCTAMNLPPGTIGPGIPFSPGGERPILTARPAPPAHVFQTSSMLEGSLIRKVQPVYPPLARTARIQGPVVLFAVISKSGTIDNLRVLSGHPMLVTAAIDAVKQWQYRPYILNHEPIEVETQITVNFILGN